MYTVVSNRSGSWNTIETRLRKRNTSSRVTTASPRNTSLPAVRFRRQLNARSSVDLPLPLGPMMDRNSLSATKKEGISRIDTPPSSTLRSSIEMILSVLLTEVSLSAE